MGGESINGQPCVQVTANMTPMLHTDRFLGDSKRASLNIAVITEHNRYDIKLSIYQNPQILNGIEVAVDNIDNVGGVLNDTVHPKNYRIKNIQQRKPVVIKDGKKYQKIVKELFYSKQHNKRRIKKI